MAIDSEELTLLAAMAYAESYYRADVFEEMAGLASVLVRQRDARGYTTMQKFVAAEPTYSFVVKDGSPRFAAVKKTNETDVGAKVKLLSDVEVKLAAEHNEIKAALIEEKDKKSIANLRSRQAEIEKKAKKAELEKKVYLAYAMAYRAARNALEGGPDFSAGAFFWDGWDIKTNYAKHFKVRQGIKITSPDHNIFSLADSLRIAILYKNRIEKTGGKTVVTRTEIGRYDHVYESTAAHGGTIFWRLNPDYISLEGAREYK